MSEQVSAATVELKKVYRLLAEDVEEARLYGQSNPSAFAYRTLCRTYFALIEGLSFQFRQVAIARGDAKPGVLTPDELYLLREEKYQLNGRGEPEASPNFQRVLPNILFSMRCYAKVHNVQFQPDIGNHGYEAMCKFVTLRNGLEHPKSVTDLTLNDEQIGQSVESAKWWKANVLRLLDKCHEADDYWKSQLA